MGLEIRPKGLTQAHMRMANIGQDYWEADFSNYHGPDNAKQITIKYLRNLEEMKDKGVGILYVGPNGPGKTTIGLVAMKYLLRANWTVHCTSLGEIVEHIQSTWGNREESPKTGSDIYTARSADFLFIDDVGKEHRGQSGFVTTVFDNLIRSRVQHRLPTFLTTNYTKSELAGTYGESVMSLLEGKLLPVTVDGEDHRRVVQKADIRGSLKR